MIYRLLAIETTGPACSVAFADGLRSDGRTALRQVTEYVGDGARNHLTELIPLTKKLLSNEGLHVQDMDAIAVSVGPGSFTGIRIGVATTRALAQATGLPVIAVPTLETFVFETDASEIVVPVFDARREQIYAGAWRLYSDAANVDAIDTIVSADAYDPKSFLDSLPVACRAYCSEPRLRFFGDGLAAYGDEIRAVMDVANMPYVFAEEGYDVQRAKNVAKWAIGFGVVSDYRTIEPTYIRQAEAKRKLDAGELKSWD